MVRHRQVLKRELKEDIIYKDKLVSKFVCKMMKHGKKSLSERIFEKAMIIVGEKTQKDPLEVFNIALNKTRPLVEVKSRRVGGATYQVPIEVKKERSLSVAMNWLISNSRKKRGKSMVEKLAQELIDTFQGTGSSIKKRDDTHKMAEANKAFSHFRW